MIYFNDLVSQGWKAGEHWEKRRSYKYSNFDRAGGQTRHLVVEMQRS